MSLAFSIIFQQSLCNEKVIEDELLFWWFSFLFHASDSSGNVPVHHSPACGGSEGEIIGGEIMRSHAGCIEFRYSCSAGAFPLYTLSYSCRAPKAPPITTGTHPPVTTDSWSKNVRGSFHRCNLFFFWVTQQSLAVSRYTQNKRNADYRSKWFDSSL